MNGLKIGALLLIAAGILGLVYGAFSSNRATHAASVGPMNITVTEHRTVNIPVWAGVGAIVVGAVLLLARRKGEA